MNCQLGDATPVPPCSDGYCRTEKKINKAASTKKYGKWPKTHPKTTKNCSDGQLFVGTLRPPWLSPVVNQGEASELRGGDGVG